MEFDPMDRKCLRCGHNDLDLKMVASGIVYSLFTCKKCQSIFRVTTQMAPDYTFLGYKVTMFPDACAKCGEKSVAYSHNRLVKIGGTPMAWDYLKCNKCGCLTQIGLHGDITALD